MDKDAAEVNAVAPPPYQHILGQPQGQWPTGQPEQQGYGQPDQPQVITSQGYAYGQQWQPQTVTSQGSFVPSQPQVYQTYQEPGHPEVITAQMNVPKDWFSSVDRTRIPTFPPHGILVILTSNSADKLPGRAHTYVFVDTDRPPDRTVLAWLVCLCCFWPTGVYAIMYAYQAKIELDKNVAKAKARRAKIFTIISLVIGLSFHVFLLILRTSI